MCSITGVGERLHKVLGQIRSKLWFPWQQKAPITYNEKNDVSTFSRLFLIGSFLYLQGGHATSSNFHQIGTCTELAALERLKISHRLIMGKSVSMLARSFLIESSSKLLVTRTGIKARKFDFPSDYSLELLALEWRKYTFELEYLLTNLDQILCVASLGVGKGCIMFRGRLDQNSGAHGNRKPPLTYNGEHGVSTFSRLLLIRSFLYLQVMRTCIKSQTSSNFRQVGPLNMELTALDSHRLIMGKCFSM